MKEHDVISQSVRFYLLYYCNPQPVFNNSERPFPYSGHLMRENPDSTVCIEILKTDSYKNKFENENLCYSGSQSFSCVFYILGTIKLCYPK